MYDETNIALVLFNANAPYITDGRGNYTFSLRSLAILLNSVAIENKPEEPKIEVDEDKIMKCIKKCMAQEKKAAVQKKAKPQLIDWGKVMALYEAGWKIKDIAGEVHEDEKTIKQGIVERL